MCPWFCLNTIDWPPSDTGLLSLMMCKKFYTQQINFLQLLFGEIVKIFGITNKVGELEVFKVVRVAIFGYKVPRTEGGIAGDNLLINSAISCYEHSVSFFQPGRAGEITQ